MILEAFSVCTSVVALAEMGDKTQLLSLCLAARYRKPLPIVLGILVATLVNHGLAAGIGAWFASQISETMLRRALSLSFIAMAGWLLIPDRLDDDGNMRMTRQSAIFVTTLWLFFVAEIGDKTQIATIGLAMRYDSLLAVVTGTTLGMMLANVPAVLLGERFAQRMPANAMRPIAAAVFAVIGLLMLLGVGNGA